MKKLGLVLNKKQKNKKSKITVTFQNIALYR